MASESLTITREDIMRNFILGCCVGCILGGIGATVSLSSAQSQPGNPYTPGSFGGSQRIYQDMISNDTDAYLNGLKHNSDPFSYLGSANPCPR